MAKEKVNNSIFLKFCRQIIKDKRYWVLLLLFFTLLFIGRNILSNNDVNKSVKNINTPEIASNDLIYESKSAINSKSGEKYHIIFQIKVNSDNDISDPTPEKIRFDLTDNLGNEKNISNLEIPVDTDYFSDQDFLFTTDKLYENLNFQKNDPSSHSTVFIKNIHITRLEGNNKIKSSFIGDFDTSKSEENLSLMDANSIIAASYSKDKEVGEIFTASHDYLTSVRMKLHFRGNGGNGNYQLVIKEINNGNISISNLSSLNFNSSTAKAIYKFDDNNEIYLFPLDAKLISGRKYFIGISSQNVQANFFNNMQIIGNIDGSKSTNGEIILVDKGKTKSKTGNLYIKYYFANQQTYAGEKANFGDKFDDLGNGTGIFSYSSSSAHSNLDIFESGNDFVTYKIDTFYPFNTLYLEVGFASSYLESDSRLSYSFNNKEWFVVGKKKDINLIDQYEQQILGDGQKKTLYIKSTSQTSDKNTFNLNSIDIHASVNINN